MVQSHCIITVAAQEDQLKVGIQDHFSLLSSNWWCLHLKGCGLTLWQVWSNSLASASTLSLWASASCWYDCVALSLAKNLFHDLVNWYGPRGFGGTEEEIQEVNASEIASAGLSRPISHWMYQKHQYQRCDVYEHNCLGRYSSSNLCCCVWRLGGRNMALIALSWLRYCNLDVLEHMLGQMQQYLQTGSTVTSYQAICVIRSFCFFIPDTFLSALIALYSIAPFHHNCKFARLWAPCARWRWGVKWGSTNTTTLFKAPIRRRKAGIIM